MKLRNIFLIILTFCMGLPLDAQNNIKLIVGSYANETGKGIYSFDFNQSTGKATPLDTLEVSNPSFLTLSSDGAMIYAVSENSENAASVHAITFDQATGRMKLRQSMPTNGADPCYVETNGNLLLTANYSGGSMSVFPLNIDGSLESMSQQFKGHTNGPDAQRQNTPHIHCTRFLPDGNGVLATDFSADQLLRFELTDMKALGDQKVTAQLSKGSGPRHIAFSTDSRFVYVMSELSGAVTVYQYNFGKMKKIQEILSDEVGARGGADIHVSPDGRFLYTSNRLKNDGITIFKIANRTGLLTKVGYQHTGIHPRHFNITPNGRFLLCACRDSNVIQVFRINSATGLLTDTHQDISVDKASCVQFYPIVMQPDLNGDGVFRVIEVTK